VLENVIYEGTPHCSVKLAQSKKNFMLNLMKGFYIYLYYTWYAMRSISGNGLRGRCLQCSMSVSKSSEDPCGFCKWLIGNGVLNNSPDIFFTCDTATNESPGVKSTSPRSMTALSNVKPWLSQTVIAHASCRGNCVCVRTLSPCSHHAVNGVMGIQAPCSLPWAYWEVGPKVGCFKCDLWLYRSETYLYIHQPQASQNMVD